MTKDEVIKVVEGRVKYIEGKTFTNTDSKNVTLEHSVLEIGVLGINRKESPTHVSFRGSWPIRVGDRIRVEFKKTPSSSYNNPIFEKTPWRIEVLGWFDRVRARYYNEKITY